MADDEVHVVIVSANLACEALGDGALVQGVPDADAVHQRRSRYAGIVVQFVHDTRVGNERAAAGNLLCNVVGDEASQVTSVVVHGDAAVCVVEHRLVDFVGAAGDRLHQTTSSDDGIELQGDIVASQLVHDELLSEWELEDHVLELLQFFRRVADGA